MSKVFDASAIIRAWEQYPHKQFPGFWRWIAAEVAKRHWIMANVKLEEVGHKAPDLKRWLLNQHLYTLDTTIEVAQRALEIKILLGIGDHYSAKGVDDNDLILIATCACHGHICITEEAEQLDSKQKLHNSKIPRVCRQRGVEVPYMGLLKCVVDSGVVFDDFARR